METDDVIVQLLNSFDSLEKKTIRNFPVKLKTNVFWAT